MKRYHVMASFSAPLALAAALWLPGVAADAADVTVTGTIHTPTGGNAAVNDVPVKHIRVIVTDEDVLIDDVQVRHTGADGKFTATFSDFVGLPDIVVDVEYVGTGEDDQFVEVRVSNTDPDPVKDTRLVDMPGCADPCALGVIHLTDTRANIVTHLGDAVRFLKAQFMGWMMTDTINAEGRNDSTGSFVQGDGSFLSVSRDDYDSPGSNANAALSDIHHEAYHWIAYRAYGDRFAQPSCSPGPHSSNTESCEAFAMNEGAAQFFGSASAPPDGKTGAPMTTDWRGTDGTGTNNSGEKVEGAYELTWTNLGDLSGSFQVLMTDAPDSIREFRDAYAIDQGRTSANFLNFLTQAAQNGIVYTRGKVTGFAEGDPPDTAMPSDGNFKIIDGVAVVRGKLKPTLVALTGAELLLESGSTISPGQKDLGFKPEMSGLGENTTGFSTFAGAVPFANDLTWDTTTASDGDHDVLIRLTSTDGWVDTFQPSFTGDTMMTLNTDEKWLKKLGTWYDQVNGPGTDKDGKIVIDNTAPTVSDFKPQ